MKADDLVDIVDEGLEDARIESENLLQKMILNDAARDIDGASDLQVAARKLVDAVEAAKKALQDFEQLL